MRVAPLDGLVTSRSTGPVTLTVTFSIALPVVSVMNNSAVVVADDGRGRGFWVVGAATGGFCVAGGVAGGGCVCGLAGAGGVAPGLSDNAACGDGVEA